MKKRIILTAITLLTVLVVHAQWRIGVTGGIDYNVFSMDKQYMTDYDIDGRLGATIGVSGQYGWPCVPT